MWSSNDANKTNKKPLCLCVRKNGAFPTSLRLREKKPMQSFVPFVPSCETIFFFPHIPANVSMR